MLIFDIFIVLFMLYCRGRKNKEEIHIFLEFKNYFRILFMTRKYNDMKSFFDLRYSCRDKRDYFVVVYKGID